MQISEIFELTDPSKLLGELSTIIFQRYQQRGFADLNEPERVFHCIWWLETEVNNGGFDQYFFNSAGNHARETSVALNAIGALQTVGILQQAMGKFAEGVPPEDRDERQIQLLDLTDNDENAFEELDNEFYKYKDDLGGLLYTYVMAHKRDYRNL